MNIDKTLQTWSNIECLRFATWCAKRVQHLNKHPSVAAAIDAAEAYLMEPSEKNRLAAYYAANAARAAYAYAAAYAADAANAATNAAADAAAYAAADAAYYAAADAYAHAAYYAARADAVYAINWAENTSITDLQLLDLYLSEQLLDIVGV